MYVDELITALDSEDPDNKIFVVSPSGERFNFTIEANADKGATEVWLKAEQEPQP